MKNPKTLVKSLTLLLLTVCLVISLASCQLFSNLFSKDEPETTPVTEPTTPNTGNTGNMGDLYYFNFIESLSTTDRIALKVNNLVYEVETDDTTPSGIKMVSSVDVAELELYYEDGKLGGAAHGKVNLTFFDTVNGSAEFSAIISNGYLYISLEGKSGNEEEKIQEKYALEELFGSMVGDMPIVDEEMSEDILSLVEDTLLPMVEALIEDNKTSIDKVLEKTLNILFAFEKQADGSVLVTLSKDKLLALNDALANKPISEVLDTYFGENTFDGMVNAIYEILDLKVSEIPAYLKDNGVDYDGLVKEIQAFLPTLGAPEDLDIDELLTNSEISNLALGMLLSGAEDDSYKTAIEENVISLLSTNTLYDLIGATADAKAEVDEVINEVFGYLSVSFITEGTGAIKATNVALNKMPMGGSGPSDGTTTITYTNYLSFSLDIIANGDIEVTWNDIIDEINNALVPAPDELKNEMSFNCESDEWPYEETVSFQGKEYDTLCYNVWVSMADFDTVYSTSISLDQDGWLCYELQIRQEEYMYQVYFVESDSDMLMFLMNPYTDEVVKIAQVSGGFNVTYENGETKYIIIANEDSMIETLAKLFPVVFADEFETYEAQGYATYYYNPTTKEYASEK